MKKYFLLLAVVLVSCCAVAQNDSALFAGTKWSIKQLAAGAKWKSIQFFKGELFSSNQVINVVEMPPAFDRLQLRLAYSDSLETTSQLAQNKNAIAAINGSFFKMRAADPDHTKSNANTKALEPSKIDRNRSIVYLKENNKLISPNDPAASGAVRKRHLQGSFVISDDAASIVKEDSVDINAENKINAHSIISSGPLLLTAGNNERVPNDAFCNDRYPRTAVGIKPDGTVLFVVVDGRAAEAAGMSIHELQKIMRWLGCKDALNMDGGGSSTMYVKGEPFNGVVNYPTDNKKFDHEGQREVANAILLLKKN